MHWPVEGKAHWVTVQLGAAVAAARSRSETVASNIASREKATGYGRLSSHEKEAWGLRAGGARRPFLLRAAVSEPGKVAG